MAINKSIIKFKGTLNGLCYYTLNGKDIIRKASGPSKERINSDPAFINVKRNNQEFGGASTISKAIRQSIAQSSNQFKDTFIASRLTGICRKIISMGNGILGQREANITINSKPLIKFQLNQSNPFSQLFTEEISVTTTPNRNQVNIQFSQITKSSFKNTPLGATHYTLTAINTIISNYYFNIDGNKYLPNNPLNNTKNTITTTIKHKINQSLPNLKITIQSPINNPNQDEALIIWLGIQYYQKTNQEYNLLNQSKSMQCIAVF